MEKLSSLKITLAVFVLFTAEFLYFIVSGKTSGGILVPVFILFLLNTGAAILTNRAFRKSLPLMSFHLSLFILISLFTAGQLSYLKGKTELSIGEGFDGTLISYEKGPLHLWRLNKVSFENNGFEMKYKKGNTRLGTTNSIRYLNSNGDWQEGVIKDLSPFISNGYNFYLTPNKGFSSIFSWIDKDNNIQRGAVHFPNYPLLKDKQAQRWTPPNSKSSIWMMLDINDTIIDKEKPYNFRLPGDHKLIVNDGGRLTEMKPGDKIQLNDGVLFYEGLTLWIGYTVFSDWTASWLLPVSIVSVLSLSWFYLVKFYREPLNPEGGNIDVE